MAELLNSRPDAKPVQSGVLAAEAARTSTRERRLSGLFRPRTELSRRSATIVGILGVVLFFGTWTIVSLSGIVPALFLPSPIAVVSRLYQMFVTEGYAVDILVSSGRVMAGFGLAAALAVPLGLLIGNISFFRALLEPLFGAARYLPATAFIPLLIIWLGLDESQKVSVIFIGTFFPLVLMIADASSSVSRDLVNSGYTLGASNRQILFRVLLPGALPAIFDQLRITVGIAWTYLIVAELVGANRGIGISILSAQRFLLTDAVIAGIVTVGILGVVTDVLFRLLHKRLFHYIR